MFTGIIEQIGLLRSRQRHVGDESLVFDAAMDWLSTTAVGDSIAVNGVCLTVTGTDGDGFIADISAETLSRTTLGEIQPGDRVNLEMALRPTDALGGHLVSGHVDCTGTVISRAADARSIRFGFEIPVEYARYVAKKGSVCIDGVSLTINEVSGPRFELNIIPHTADVTNIGDYKVGTIVNVEVDLVARYLERLIGANPDGISEDFLKAHGYG